MSQRRIPWNATVCVGLSVLLVFLAAAGCRRQPHRVVIGVAVSSVYHPGVIQATKEINAAGGINGVPLELMGMNWKVTDQYDPKEILAWARRFAANPNLVAVIGHSDSVSTLSAAAFYNQHQIPQIVTIATNPAITNIGVWTYRLCLSDAAQGPALARYAVQDWKKKRIAVFYVNDDYGRGLAESFEDEVRQLGGAVVASVMHRNVLEPDDKDLIRSVLLQLKKDHSSQLVVLIQRPAAALWTIQTIHQIGLKTDILGGDNLSSTEFVTNPSPLIEGVHISQFFFPLPQNSLTTRFVQQFRDSTHMDPDYGQAFAYDAIYLIRDAVRYGGFSRTGVKSYLDHLIQRQTPVQGAGGEYRLNREHDAKRSLYIVALHHGKQELVKALPAAYLNNRPTPHR